MPPCGRSGPQIAPGVADTLHLGVFGERVGDLPIPASIWVRNATGSSSGSSVSLFIIATSSSRVSATTKSAPWDLNASTGAGAPLLISRSRSMPSRSELVISGFCSEPDSANSFSMIRCVRMNQLWSYGAMSGVVRR